jgi:hydroxymethylpyrimidine/phosphomethylpyrimidine kinase
MQKRPCVLCIAGHDPTGGAGIQADIEAVSALGGRALSLVTALTVQDTGNVREILPTPADVLRRCFATLVDDIQPDAIKIGLLGCVETVDALADLLAARDRPVVLDPVLAAGGGFGLASPHIEERLMQKLVPLATLITPNRAESRRLSGQQDPGAGARALLNAGAGAVLLTGADEARGDTVLNTLWQAGCATQDYRWPLLAGTFHGSGCTLASACAVRLAAGDTLTEAVDAAQRFTQQSLKAAESVGHKQLLPRRI